MRFPSITLFALSTILPTLYAAPWQYTDSSLQRRAETIIVEGHTAVIGDKIGLPSSSSCAVHRITSWDGEDNPGYVIKKFGSMSFGQKEIEGLKSVHQYIASDERESVIVMREAKGKTLKELLKGHVNDRVQYLQKWIPKIAAETARIATMDGIVLEIDEKTGVETGVVTLIDWENYVISGQYGFTEDAEDIQKKLRRSWLPG
ncbi:hypothetical protein BDP27DRAFT_1424090 [Rhodocollybia butyracea]|uniref:Chalcone isomerase domain-containing protein n=1 Tax=Rhodocollybia butyracea TaxID=206335 RepID=A0A9P5U519_9AGAR|nr:hypothetical protein BDP27DRAFT_1424090 [Rhodocollybia butyracea]